MGLSAHHIGFERSAWTSRPDAASIRNTPSLIPRIDRIDHNALHEVCPPVPLLGSYALRSVARGFIPHQDTIKSLEALMGAIEAAGRHPRAHRVETKLSQLAIEALDTQRLFLKGIL